MVIDIKSDDRCALGWDITLQKYTRVYEITEKYNKIRNNYDIDEVEPIEIGYDEKVMLGGFYDAISALKHKPDNIVDCIKEFENKYGFNEYEKEKQRYINKYCKIIKQIGNFLYNQFYKNMSLRNINGKYNYFDKTSSLLDKGDFIDYAEFLELAHEAQYYIKRLEDVLISSDWNLKDDDKRNFFDNVIKKEYGVLDYHSNISYYIFHLVAPGYNILKERMAVFFIIGLLMF